MFAGDEFEREEHRMRACVQYVVAQQYRRGAQAQQALCDALEDVLLNGLAVLEACAMHAGVSEHVLGTCACRLVQFTYTITGVYVARVRSGCTHLGAPLSALHTRTRDAFVKAGGLKSLVHQPRDRSRGKVSVDIPNVYKYVCRRRQ
jgi:hypothetical protein